MVRQKEEKRVRLLQLQHANREADMLGDFIRLVDWMEVETLVKKCLDHTSDWLSTLLQTTKPLFITAVAFQGQGGVATGGPALVFTPTERDITGMLTSLSDLTINAMDNLSRVIFHSKFQPLIGAGGGGAGGWGGRGARGGID